MKLTTLVALLIQSTLSSRVQRSNPFRLLAGSSRRLSRLAMTTVMTFALAACVTINIYFPASAAEKAADKIIDEVWQAQGSGNDPAAPSTDKVEKP